MPVILGCDFIAGENMTLNCQGGGHRLEQQPELTPFTRPEDCICNPQRQPTSQWCQSFACRRPGFAAKVPREQRGETSWMPSCSLSHQCSQKGWEKPTSCDTALKPVTCHLGPWRCNPGPISIHKRTLLDVALEDMIYTGSVPAV